MDIRLNFINRSNDTNNSQIVIFSRNVATNLDELAVAWQVIKNCGQGDNHPFVYPLSSTIGAGDSYGNYTPQSPAQFGQLFHVALTSSGDTLSLVGQGSSPKAIELRNDLARGSINGAIYKSGKLFAIKTGIVPGQLAVFGFEPKIWIGAVSEVDEGSVMNSAIISSVNTEISLLGIASADIVMTGGGSGPDAAPFTFELTNVNMA